MSRNAIDTSVSDHSVSDHSVSGSSVSDTTLTTDAAAYCLQLGDDALIYAQRLGDWISRAPQIEEDLSLIHI